MNADYLIEVQSPVISGSFREFKQTFQRSDIRLKPNARMALLSSTVDYNNSSLRVDNENNRFRWKHNGVAEFVNVTLQNGFYSFSNLPNEIRIALHSSLQSSITQTARHGIQYSVENENDRIKIQFDAAEQTDFYIGWEGSIPPQRIEIDGEDWYRRDDVGTDQNCWAYDWTVINWGPADWHGEIDLGPDDDADVGLALGTGDEVPLGAKYLIRTDANNTRNYLIQHSGETIDTEILCHRGDILHIFTNNNQATYQVRANDNTVRYTRTLELDFNKASFDEVLYPLIILYGQGASIGKLKFHPDPSFAPDEFRYRQIESSLNFNNVKTRQFLGFGLNSYTGKSDPETPRPGRFLASKSPSNTDAPENLKIAIKNIDLNAFTRAGKNPYIYTVPFFQQSSAGKLYHEVSTPVYLNMNNGEKSLDNFIIQLYESKEVNGEIQDVPLELNNRITLLFGIKNSAR